MWGHPTICVHPSHIGFVHDTVRHGGEVIHNSGLEGRMRVCHTSKALERSLVTRERRRMSDIVAGTFRSQGPHPWALCALLQRWSARVALAISLIVVLVGCAAVPRQYVQMAEPGATLTALSTHPESYRGKVVLLGGTIVGDEENGSYLWLRVMNRPLDQDYIPHRPVDSGGSEAGHYWVMMPKQQFPREYRHWARMTVVGRVTDTQRLVTEPVLSLLYVRGWGTSPVHDAVWEDSSDPNYIPSVPAGVRRESDPQ